MPRIDRFLEDRTWGDLHEDTQEYVKHNLVDVTRTYEVNQENDYLEEIGEVCVPWVILKNGLAILADRVDVWHCNVGAGVYIDFNDYESFEFY